MPRWFFIVVTLFGLAAAASYAATTSDPVGILIDKLAEGGLWTMLAVSIVAALILGLMARRTDRPAPPPRK